MNNGLHTMRKTYSRLSNVDLNKLEGLTSDTVPVKARAKRSRSNNLQAEVSSGQASGLQNKLSSEALNPLKTPFRDQYLYRNFDSPLDVSRIKPISQTYQISKAISMLDRNSLFETQSPSSQKTRNIGQSGKTRVSKIYPINSPLQESSEQLYNPYNMYSPRDMKLGRSSSLRTSVPDKDFTNDSYNVRDNISPIVLEKEISDSVKNTSPVISNQQQYSLPETDNKDGNAPEQSLIEALGQFPRNMHVDPMAESRNRIAEIDAQIHNMQESISVNADLAIIRDMCCPKTDTFVGKLGFVLGALNPPFLGTTLLSSAKYQDSNGKKVSIKLHKLFEEQADGRTAFEHLTKEQQTQIKENLQYWGKVKNAASWVFRIASIALGFIGFYVPGAGVACVVIAALIPAVSAVANVCIKLFNRSKHEPKVNKSIKRSEKCQKDLVALQQQKEAMIVNLLKEQNIGQIQDSLQDKKSLTESLESIQQKQEQDKQPNQKFSELQPDLPSVAARSNSLNLGQFVKDQKHAYSNHSGITSKPTNESVSLIKPIQNLNNKAVKNRSERSSISYKKVESVAGSPSPVSHLRRLQDRSLNNKSLVGSIGK